MLWKSCENLRKSLGAFENMAMFMAMIMSMNMAMIMAKIMAMIMAMIMHVRTCLMLASKKGFGF